MSVKNVLSICGKVTARCDSAVLVPVLEPKQLKIGKVRRLKPGVDFVVVPWAALWGGLGC